MPYANSLSIVIPCYNEEANIEAVVQEARETLQSLTDTFDIVVVDDASTDASWQILQDLARQIPQLKTLQNPVNIGCHPSTLVGYQAAQGDYCFFIPADRQIPADEIGKFLAKAQSGCQVVYSWRQHRADPSHRRLLSQGYNCLLRLCFGLNLHDVDSAQLLSKGALDLLLPHIRSDSAFITVEILLAAQKQNLTIGEVVVEHRPRTAGAAHGINVKDACKVPVQFLGMLIWCWQQRFSGHKKVVPHG